jgi:hypothetical protein
MIFLRYINNNNNNKQKKKQLSMTPQDEKDNKYRLEWKRTLRRF